MLCRPPDVRASSLVIAVPVARCVRWWLALKEHDVHLSVNSRVWRSVNSERLSVYIRLDTERHFCVATALDALFVLFGAIIFDFRLW